MTTQAIPGTKTIDDALLAQYASLIYDRTGIRLSPQKKALVSNRLSRRLRETGIPDFKAYFDHVRNKKPADPEWNAFLQEITTHETYLFRDQAHWDWFQNVFLPELQSDARKGTRPKQLRIWSAACSTGDEAYSIASCFADGIATPSQWKIEIVGTDIGVGALEQAMNPVFGERAMRLVPDQIKSRHFKKTPDADVWQPKDALRNMTAFSQHNLIQPFAKSPFDIVFLKNVLIYFDKESKRVVVDNVLAKIAPGGFLIAGAAEGISDLMRGEKSFEQLQSWLYRKQS